MALVDTENTGFENLIKADKTCSSVRYATDKMQWCKTFMRGK